MKKELERRVQRMEAQTPERTAIDLSHLSDDDLRYLSRLPFKGDQIDLERLTRADLDRIEALGFEVPAA